MKITVNEAIYASDIAFGDLRARVEQVAGGKEARLSTWSEFKKVAQQRAKDLGSGWRIATLGDILWIKTFDGSSVKQRPVSGYINSSAADLRKAYEFYLAKLEEFIRSSHPALADMLRVVHDNKPSFYPSEYPYNDLVQNVLDIRCNEAPSPNVEVLSTTYNELPTYALFDSSYDGSMLWQQKCIFVHGPHKEVDCLANSLSQYIPAITKRVEPLYKEALREAGRKQRIAGGESAATALAVAKAYAETPGKGQGVYKVSWYDGMRGDPIDRTFTVKADNYLDLYAQALDGVFGNFWDDAEHDCKLPEDVEEYVGQFRSKEAFKKWFDEQDVSDRHIYKIVGGDISWEI